MKLRSLLVIAAIVSTVGAEGRQAPVEAASNAPFFAGITDTASLTQAVDARLARAQQRLDALLAFKGARTIENTLRPYDDIRIEVDGANALARAVLQLHPDADMRKTGEALAERSAAFLSDLALNRGAYDALASLEVSRAAAEPKHYIQRELGDYRLKGVEKDEATRQRIRTLREEHIRLMQEFQRNLRAGVRRFQVPSAAELDGLPADFIAAHKPGPDGTITLTTAGPNLQPVLTYARNEALRRRMLIEANNVAYPANKTVIERLVATRAELAQLLNHSTWADYDTADRMAGSARAAASFIDQIIAASGPKAAKETAMLLEEWARDPATLALFAKHYQTGEPIPARLVNQMRRAGELGRAIDTRQQMLFARLSLSVHDRDPKDVDTDALERDLTTKYLPMPYVDGTHFAASFTHLADPNYTAAYYTYMWSQVIAKDLFDQFNAANLLDPKMMRRYRDLILAPAGSKPAASLVADFLGRPFNAKAWEKWLNTEV